MEYIRFCYIKIIMEDKNQSSYQAEAQSKQSTQEFKNEVVHGVRKLYDEYSHANKNNNPNSTTISHNRTPTDTYMHNTNIANSNAGNVGTSGAVQVGSSTSGSASTVSGTVGATTVGSGTAVGTTGVTGAGATASTTAASTAGASAGASASAGAAAGTAGVAAATAGTAAATGAATFGIGAIITIVVSLLLAGTKMAVDKLKAESESIWHAAEKPDKEMGKFFWIAIFGFLIVIIILCSTLTPFAGIASGVTSNAEEAVNYVLDTVNDAFLTDKQKYFKDVFGESVYSDELAEMVESPRELDAANIEVYKKIIDDAIYKSFAEYAGEYVWGIDSFIEIVFLNYSYHATYQQYLNQPYPYTLGKEVDGEIQYYTIEQFLNHEIPSEEVNNDLNYAEIITVFCQREENGFETFSFSDFYDVLMAEEVGELLYELEFGEKHFGVYNDEQELLIDDDASDYLSSIEVIVVDEYRPEVFSITLEEMQQIASVNTGFYFHDVKVSAYGLKDLYEIAGLDAYDYHSTFNSRFNYELLDINEKWLRTTLPHGIDLGVGVSDYRSELSLSYNAILEQTEQRPTGRSLYTYLDSSVAGEEIVLAEWVSEEKTSNRLNFHISGESVVLSMPSYINQGASPYKYIPVGDTTVKAIGCCICSYAMVLDYYSQTQSGVSEIEYIIDNYVNEHNNLQYGNLLLDNGLKYVSQAELQAKWPNEESLKGIMINTLTEGNPVVLNIRGIWEYNGVVYHATAGGHFLVVTGYDETGFYVYDPGSKKNTTNGPIPYDAFDTVTIVKIASSTGGNISYSTNSMSQEGENTNE